MRSVERLQLQLLPAAVPHPLSLRTAAVSFTLHLNVAISATPGSTSCAGHVHGGQQGRMAQV